MNATTTMTGARRVRFSDSIELDPFPAAVPDARDHTRTMLRAWRLDELADDAEQIVAELIANSVEATREAGLGTQVRLVLVAGLRTLLIAVWDPIGAPPVPQLPGLDAESGRGLMIVAALAARWDWKPARGGKVVRVLLRGNRLA